MVGFRQLIMLFVVTERPRASTKLNVLKLKSQRLSALSQWCSQCSAQHSQEPRSTTNKQSSCSLLNDEQRWRMLLQTIQAQAGQKNRKDVFERSLIWSFLVVFRSLWIEAFSKFSKWIFQVKNHVSISWIFLKIQKRVSTLFATSRTIEAATKRPNVVAFYQILFEWAILCKKVLSDVI